MTTIEYNEWKSLVIKEYKDAGFDAIDSPDGFVLVKTPDGFLEMQRFFEFQPSVSVSVRIYKEGAVIMPAMSR